MRREFSKAVKRAAFERASGHCEGLLPNGLRCGNAIRGVVEYDHDKPDYMGGEPVLENCVALCQTCHRQKTGKERKVIDKTRRIVDRNKYGIKKKRTIRAWRKFDGTPVYANKER